MYDRLHTTLDSLICSNHGKTPLTHSLTHSRCPSCSISLTLPMRFKTKTWGDGTFYHTSPAFSLLVWPRGANTAIPGRREMTGRIGYWLAMRGTVSFPTNFIQNKFHHYMSTRAYFSIVSCLVHYVSPQKLCHQDYPTVLHHSLL